MANSVAATTSHHGPIGGKVRAISHPVTSAEPSPRNSQSGFLRIASMIASPARAAAEASASWISTPAPKNQTYAAMPGNSAAITRSMTLRTLAGWRK